MPITLNDIVLPDGLLIDNALSWSGIDSVVEKSAGGRPLIWEQVTYGRPITLKGPREVIYLQYSTILELQAIASEPGMIYVLDYNGTSYNVRFAHENSPALFATALVPRDNHQPADWFHRILHLERPPFSGR